MIDSEVQGNMIQENISPPLNGHRQLISSRTYKSYSEGILASLQVSQSKMVDLVQDRVYQPLQKSVHEQTECQSCQAWSAWSLQSQQMMLLIQKKLIQRQKILHERIKSLQMEADQKSKAYEKLERQYEQQKTKDKKSIEQLMSTIQEFKKQLKNSRGVIKAQRSYKSSNNFQICNVVKQEDDQNCQQGFMNIRENIRKINAETHNSSLNEPKILNYNSGVSLNLGQNSNENRQPNQEMHINLFQNKLPNIQKNCQFPTAPSLSQPQSKNKVQSSDHIQNLKTSKSQYFSRVSNHQKEVSTDHNEQQGASKTIKLNNQYINVEKSRINNATSECSFIQDTGYKTSNIYSKQPYDERTTLISHTESKNRMMKARNPESGDRPYEGKKISHELIQQVQKLQFENENLKSYNRVLLQKLSNSRPRKY